MPHWRLFRHEKQHAQYFAPRNSIRIIRPEFVTSSKERQAYEFSSNPIIPTE